jgi:hypothetical protein
LVADRSASCNLLADALLAFIESSFAASARPRLCKATIEVERAATSIHVPEKAAETVAEAANYAQVLISHPGFPGRERELLPAVNAAVLAREQARILLQEGKAGDALPKYAESMRGYYVTDVPTQYELVGDHKLVLHDQCYYVLPRDVQEFMIFEGTVYRLTGIGRHTRRHVPAWLIALLFPYVSLLRNLKARAREWRARAISIGVAMAIERGQRLLRSVVRAGRIGRVPAKAISLCALAAIRWTYRTVPQLRSFLRQAVRLGYRICYRLLTGKSERPVVRPYKRSRFRFWSDPRLHSIMREQCRRFIRIARALTHHLKRMIFKTSWCRYAVEGVVTAHRRETALAMIAKISNVPPAGSEAGACVVRRPRLTRVGALGPGA